MTPAEVAIRLLDIKAEIDALGKELAELRLSTSESMPLEKRPMLLVQSRTVLACVSSLITTAACQADVDAFEGYYAAKKDAAQ